jgi:hypothetical protein
LKSRGHIAKCLIRPMELLIQRPFEQREYLTIDVKNCRCHKQQRANDPPITATG